MALHSAHWEFRNVFVGDAVFHINLLAQAAEASAENDARFGDKAAGGLFQVFSDALDAL